MYYRFRIFYSGLAGMMILMLGYLYDIRPLIYQAKELAASRQLLNARLQETQLFYQHHTNFSAAREEVKSDWLTLIQASGLRINAIKQENENILDANLSGSFYALFSFLEKWKEAKLRSFSFTLDKNNLLIHLRIRMPPKFMTGKFYYTKEKPDDIKTKTPAISQKINDPFCLPRLIVH